MVVAVDNALGWMACKQQMLHDVLHTFSGRALCIAYSLVITQANIVTMQAAHVRPFVPFPCTPKPSDHLPQSVACPCSCRSKSTSTNTSQHCNNYSNATKQLQATPHCSCTSCRGR